MASVKLQIIILRVSEEDGLLSRFEKNTVCYFCSFYMVSPRSVTKRNDRQRDTHRLISPVQRSKLIWSKKKKVQNNARKIMQASFGATNAWGAKQTTVYNWSLVVAGCQLAREAYAICYCSSAGFGIGLSVLQCRCVQCSRKVYWPESLQLFLNQTRGVKLFYFHPYIDE